MALKESIIVTMQKAESACLRAFLNQPVEVAQFRPQLAALLGIGDKRPDLVVRFGYGPNMPMSMRRPITDVMTSV
jgi:hypothetical protein